MIEGVIGGESLTGHQKQLCWDKHFLPCMALLFNGVMACTVDVPIIDVCKIL